MIKLNTIYNEDCLEGMKRIEDKSVDMILCDLPYGTTACTWDTIIPFDLLWEQYHRVIRTNGYIVLFGSQPFTSKLVGSNIENYSHQWIWDKKMSANPLLCKKMPMKNFEDIVVFCQNYDLLDKRRDYFSEIFRFIGKSKKQILLETNQGLDHCFRFKSKQFDIPTETNYTLLNERYDISKMDGYIPYGELNVFHRVYNPQMKQLKKSRNIGGGKLSENDFVGINYLTEKRTVDTAYPTAIIEFSNRKGKSLHPTQKPVSLFEYLIKTYTNENETILDNCMGSGTTAIAAIHTNRNFIGFELDGTYFNLANKRISEELGALIK